MQVSAGEHRARVEIYRQRLPRICNHFARWEGVPPLAKGDVLFEQRSAQDTHRSALVRVVLQALDYYQWMIFLTTNRVGQVDGAIASRIYLELKFVKLNREHRTIIKRPFLEKAATL